MGEDLQVTRQWKLLRTLASRQYGVPIAELAKDLKVNERTIRRDLAELKAVGFPLTETTLDHGKKVWKISGDTLVPGMVFPLDEALALYLGRRLLEPLAGTPVYQAAHSAFAKIKAALGKSALDYLDRMAGRVYHSAFGAGDYAERGEWIDELLMAIDESRVTLVNYQSLKSTEPVEYELYPLGLAWHKGALFLVARSTQHNKEIRTFKVDRITSVSVSTFTFNPPENFDLAAHLSGSFGVYHGDGDIVVRVRFLPPVVRYVEEGRWHATQQLARQGDGSLLAEFRLSSTVEIAKWLLSFGRNAEVLEPMGLRDEMATEHRAALQQYCSTTKEGGMRKVGRVR